jgi:hypothetical protein
VRRQLLKSFQFIYNSYLFLALIAGISVWQISFGNSYYALFCSLSVFLTYNTLRYFKSKKNALSSELEIWWNSNRRILFTMMFGVLLSIIFLITLDPDFWIKQWVEFGVALVSLAFYHAFSFRKIPLVKNLLIALVWTLVAVYVPNGSNLVLPFFLIFLSLSIQSDIKDLERDDFSTFAKILGRKASIVVVNFLIVVSLLIFNLLNHLTVLQCLIVFFSFTLLQKISLKSKNFGELSDLFLLFFAFILNW